MLLNHSQAFADFAPARAATPPHLPLPRREEIGAFTRGTLLETPEGWRPVEQLAAGDRVWTLDGGFAEISGVSARPITPGSTRHWRVPAGSLNNCSALHLTAGQHIALIEPQCATLFDAPCVLAPVSAMAGFRGITPVCAAGGADAVQIEFADEEIVYAQTGTLLHVPGSAQEPFFRCLDYGETRALLALLNGGHCGLDPHGFAPARAA